MQQDIIAATVGPRVCPWCISTNTFAAKRCAICGLDLGVEVRALRAALPPPPAASPAVRAPRGIHISPLLLGTMLMLALTLVLVVLLVLHSHL